MCNVTIAIYKNRRHEDKTCYSQGQNSKLKAKGSQQEVTLNGMSERNGNCGKRYIGHHMAQCMAD
jgi:hypothetical protein